MKNNHNTQEGRPQRKQRILVVDDEVVVCMSCKEILSGEQYNVDCYQNPQEGLKAALTGNYDVILLDIVMPEMGGIEILKTIKTSEVPSEVVIITGYSTVQNAVEAMKLGAFDYISKPFTPDELRLVIARTLERSNLIRENTELRRQLELQQGFHGILGESSPMEHIYKLMNRIAPTDGTVLITGESGTGKEMIAEVIHRLSQRSDQPFVACDCTSLVPTLLESELFGHIKGSFSGAIATKQGLFEIANKGTLFLDEVGNISMETQGKLLRVLENRRVKKVGDTVEREIDIRLIVATNRNLQEMVDQGTFRDDLFYRINVIPLNIPPLRERIGDIPRLAMIFLERCRTKYKVKAQYFTPEAMRLIESYPWPGNVRELKNVIERIAIISNSKQINPDCLPSAIRQMEKQLSFGEKILPKTWEELKEYKYCMQDKVAMDIERKFIVEALRRLGGNVTKAAQEVGMQRTNFHALMRKYGIHSGDFEIKD